MDLEQIQEHLDAALPLRSPKFKAGESTRIKINHLEDYLLLSAHVAGDLIEARYRLRLAEDSLRESWDGLAGWEVAVGNKPRGKLTKQDIEEAKIKTSPNLHAALRKAALLRVSLDDQITRFEREERVVSRAYTMIAGS